MLHETLDFGEGEVEISIVDNIIYLKTLRLYTDAIAREMMRYLEKIIHTTPRSTIRVWDARSLSSDSFKLTGQCVQEAVAWSDKIKREKPGSKAYFITTEPLIFGTTRMYTIQADDKDMGFEVIRSIDELPDEIRKKLSLRL